MKHFSRAGYFHPAFLPAFIVTFTLASFLPFSFLGASETASEVISDEFGKMKLVQEITCGETLPDAEFPEKCSFVETVLGTPCRTLHPNDETTQYFAYKIGAGRGLKPGTAYVLCVEYPEDASRSMFIHNGGSETVSGFATGQACGDVAVGRYVNHNPESLKYPLSGKYESWTGLFFLHDRFCGLQRPRGTGERPLLPEDGFWVLISNAYAQLDPLSAGAAVRKIRLYEVLEPEKLALEVHYPPKNLPKRYIFWREEMADGVIDTAYKKKEPENRGVENALDWYKYKILWGRAMGVNTFCKDLLEFGHNQGWNSDPYGGNGWVFEPAYNTLWDDLVKMCAEYKLPMIPYYEYCGSLGGDEKKSLGFRKRAVRLEGKGPYTHIWWSEKGNVDLSDPDTLADFEKILDCTVLKYKGEAEIPGIWLRQRVSQTPVSFNERNLRDFASEANGGKSVSREELKQDAALREKYYDWWFSYRRKFLEGVAKYLREKGNPDSFVLYTADGGEPGCSLRWQECGKGKKDSWKYKTAVVTDDFDAWEKIMNANPMYDKRFVKPVTIQEVLEGNFYDAALSGWPENWGGWEVSHAIPPADPENLKNSEDVMFSYTIHRTYSASDPATMERYRTGAGLTCVRHFPLNENELNTKGADGKEFEPAGYFVADVERAGVFCVMPEVRAVAFGDPTRLGYLAANTFQRGFPSAVRAFNAAYLALPALPSELIQAEKYGKEYVRKIETPKNGTYYALCSLEETAKTQRVDGLTAGSTLTDCVSGETFRVKKDGTVEIPMKPMSLRTFHQ